MQLTKEQQLLQDIITRAWDDDGFKQELIADPVTVLERLTGKPITLPEGKNIVVLDQMDESNIYINIPAKPNLENMELNEVQLEVIAGGGALSNPIFRNPAAGLSDIS